MSDTWWGDLTRARSGGSGIINARHASRCFMAQTGWLLGCFKAIAASSLIRIGKIYDWLLILILRSDADRSSLFSWQISAMIPFFTSSLWLVKYKKYQISYQQQDQDHHLSRSLITSWALTLIPSILSSSVRWSWLSRSPAWCGGRYSVVDSRVQRSRKNEHSDEHLMSLILIWWLWLLLMSISSITIILRFFEGSRGVDLQRTSEAAASVPSSRSFSPALSQVG